MIQSPRLLPALILAPLMAFQPIAAHAQQRDLGRLDATVGLDKAGLDTSGLSVPYRGMAFGQATTTSQAATPPGTSPGTSSATPPGTLPGAAAPKLGTPGALTVTQPITVQAGTGVLLRLPSPAATVISAEPAVARVQPASPTSLFLMGVDRGHTTVVALDAAGMAIVQYDVTVTPSGRGTAPAAAAPAATTTGVSAATAARIQATIAQTVAGATGVTARAAGNEVIINGLLPDSLAAQQAEAIARAYAGEKAGVLDRTIVLSTLQVNVRVRICEIDRTITRQLGFNWQVLGNNGTWTLGLLTGAATGGVISALRPLGLTALPNAAVPYQLGGGYHSANWDINGVIDALAADQLITVLAEPNLTAQSGEVASFLAGGEFPVPISGSTSNGTPTITVEYKSFGVSLAVVPTVLSPDRLNLRIRPEVSQLSNNGAVSLPLSTGVVTIPALTVRRAETTVELGSGQSFAIAGLLQKTSADQTNALPFLGEIPVLGALFKSNDFQRGESELVIIVTPYLVRPVSNPSQLHAPTDGFHPATDLERILFNRQIAPATPPLDAGFVVK